MHVQSMRDRKKEKRKKQQWKMKDLKWKPATKPLCIKTVDMHTVGEPVRIIVSGYPEVKGQTMLEKRRYAREHLDHLRKLVVLEPRGHADMYCALLVKPTLPEAHLAVLFLDNHGYSTMCGHAVISLGRYAVDHGLVAEVVSPETKVNIECPCGLVSLYVEHDGEKSGSVRFHSVPAFAFHTDVEITTATLGKVEVDISYGGNFYAIVSADKLGLDLETSDISDIRDAANEVSVAVKQQIKLKSPENQDLAFLYGTIVTDGNDSFSASPTSNICVFGDNKQVDRSPCGSGVTARVALQYHKGLIPLDKVRHFRSVLTDGIFKARVVKEVTSGSRDGVQVEVSSRGFYSGKCEFILEDSDVIGKGFRV